jgi:hypothetical protein
MKSFGKWFADQSAPVAPAAPDEPELPNGLWMSSLGLTYKCYACGEASEWFAGAEDFDINNSANQCGRSPRCCP